MSYIRQILILFTWAYSMYVVYDIQTVSNTHAPYKICTSRII